MKRPDPPGFPPPGARRDAATLGALDEIVDALSRIETRLDALTGLADAPGSVPEADVEPGELIVDENDPAMWGDTVPDADWSAWQDVLRQT